MKLKYQIPRNMTGEWAAYLVKRYGQVLLRARESVESGNVKYLDLALLQNTDMPVEYVYGAAQIAATIQGEN